MTPECKILVVEKAIQILEESQLKYTCWCLDRAALRLFGWAEGERVARVVKVRYEAYTCKYGQPRWWNAGMPYKEERIAALRAFKYHLERSNNVSS